MIVRTEGHEHGTVAAIVHVQRIVSEAQQIVDRALATSDGSVMRFDNETPGFDAKR